MKNNSYDDIINLPHPVSKNHPQMPLRDRAAQFAPFAALTGHDAAIKETARWTDERLELSEEAIAQLNEKINIIRNNIGIEQKVSITYFIPDAKKAGGSYVTCSGIVKKIDEYEHTIIMTDQTVIPIEQISDIKCEEWQIWELDGGKYRIPMLCERLAGKTGILLKNTHYNYKPKNMNSAYLLLFRNFPGVVL